MYNFIDTNGVQTNTALPAEAVKFNGQWLDRVVPGFKTLSVRGRESYQLSVTEEQEISVCNRGKRFIKAIQEPRTITVKFMLSCATNADFRDSVNKLHRYLAPTQKRLIFNDETDKFYTATAMTIPEFDEGKNEVVGEIGFYCTDPRKYSVDYVTETITGDDTVSVDADDLIPCILTITANSNLNSLTLNGLAHNKVKGTNYSIVIKNLQNGIPVIINGETMTATQNGLSKFIDGELTLKAFPTLKAGNNAITFAKSSDVVTVTVEIKYRKTYV